jgi:hypothetical protein
VRHPFRHRETAQRSWPSSRDRAAVVGRHRATAQRSWAVIASPRSGRGPSSRDRKAAVPSSRDRKAAVPSSPRSQSARGRHRETAQRSWPSSRDRAAVVAIQAGPPVPGLLRPLGLAMTRKPRGGEVPARVGMAAGPSSRLARSARSRRPMRLQRREADRQRSRHRETAQRSWPSSRDRAAVVSRHREAAQRSWRSRCSCLLDCFALWGLAMTVNQQAARTALGAAWQPVVHHASLDIAVIARPRSGSWPSSRDRAAVVAVIARPRSGRGSAVIARPRSGRGDPENRTPLDCFAPSGARNDESLVRS